MASRGLIAVVGVAFVVLMTLFLSGGGGSSATSSSAEGTIGGGTAFAALSSNRGYPVPIELYHVPPPTSSNGRTPLRIVVTGGAGFIGSQLAHALWLKGHDVTLIDNMRFGYEDNLNVDGKRFGRFVLGDVLDTRTWAYFHKADVIFHFAALSALPVCQSHPRDAMNVNVGGFANVLEGARQAGVKRIIFASTSATYERNSEPVLSEDLTVAPTLLYSLSKAQGEQLLQSYRDVYGIEGVILRFFNVYGPHQDFRRRSPPFTSYVARELAHGRRPVLHGDGTQARDYVHVRDLLRFAETVMDHPQADGQVFNIASGRAMSVNDMYRIMAAAANMSHIRPVFHEAAGFWKAYPELFAGGRPIKQSILEKEVMKKTTGTFEKAERILGWRPEVPMEEGLAELVYYVKDAVAKGKDRDAAETAWKA